MSIESVDAGGTGSAFLSGDAFLRGRGAAWLSAILLALAFSGAWPLVFVALAPILLRLQTASAREAWRGGYLFGLLFSLSQLWWLGDLAYRWTGSVLLGVIPWIVASCLTAVFYGFLGALIRSCFLLRASWAIPLVWAGVEVLRSYVPVLAFPWALLAEPLIARPALAGNAHYGTIYLLSAIIVAANVALVTVKSARAATTFGAIYLALFLAGCWHGGGERPGVRRYAAGQPGVDLAFDPDANEKIGPAVDGLFREAAGADLLVLPEGISQGGSAMPPVTPFHVPSSPPVVFGGQRGEGVVYQSAFGRGANGWSFADKTRLVIFGEFVPGRELFPALKDAFRLPGGDLSAGSEVKNLLVGKLAVGPLLCFEALFPDLTLRQARSADVLAVMSIDDWFAMPARERLARAAQWRAIEAGRPVVRAGSLGRTEIISPFGEVLSSAPYGARRIVSAMPPPGRGPFPLVWVFPAVSLASLVAIPLWSRRRR